MRTIKNYFHNNNQETCAEDLLANKIPTTILDDFIYENDFYCPKTIIIKLLIVLLDFHLI